MLDIDVKKLNRVMELIDEIAQISDNNKDKISEIEKLTGKSNIDEELFYEY